MEFIADLMGYRPIERAHTTTKSFFFFCYIIYIYMFVYLFIYSFLHTLHYITLRYVTLHYITLHTYTWAMYIFIE